MFTGASLQIAKRKPKTYPQTLGLFFAREDDTATQSIEKKRKTLGLKACLLQKELEPISHTYIRKPNNPIERVPPLAILSFCVLLV